MSDIPNTLETRGPFEDPAVDKFTQMLERMWESLARVVNNHIGFGDGTEADNIDGVWKTVITPGAPNTDFVVVHNLGRIPVGYIPMMKSASVDIFTGSVPADKNNITLRATASGVTVSLFII